MNFSDFQPLYDFSLIEKAVQALFVGVDGGVFVAPLDDNDPAREQWTAGAGNIAFYTAFQALTFQLCRPRVFIGLHNVNCITGAYAVDANGNLREKAWRGQMRIGIITEPNYTSHTKLRSAVLSIIPQILGAVTVTDFPNTGINALLNYHQVSEFYSRDVSTSVTPEDGSYQSAISVELAFNIKPTAFPSGMILV